MTKTRGAAEQEKWCVIMLDGLWLMVVGVSEQKGDWRMVGTATRKEQNEASFSAHSGGSSVNPIAASVFDRLPRYHSIHQVHMFSSSACVLPQSPDFKVLATGCRK